MKTYKIIFSPTGGTEKAANAIISNWADTEPIDLSNNNANYNISLEEGSLALIAMPSFGGLAPQLALDRLSKIKANGCKCVIVAVLLQFLSDKLTVEFGKGFDVRNLRNMRQFYMTFPIRNALRSE